MTLKTIITDWSPTWRDALDELIASDANLRRLGRYDSSGNYIEDGEQYRKLHHYETFTTAPPTFLQVPGSVPTFVVLIPLVAYARAITFDADTLTEHFTVPTNYNVYVYVQGFGYYYENSAWRVQMLESISLPVERPPATRADFPYGVQETVNGALADKIHWREFTINSIVPSVQEPWRAEVRDTIPPFGDSGEDGAPSFNTVWVSQVFYSVTLTMRFEVNCYVNPPPGSEPDSGELRWFQHDQISLCPMLTFFAKDVDTPFLQGSGFLSTALLENYYDPDEDGVRPTGYSLGYRFGSINGVSSFARGAVAIVRTDDGAFSTAYRRGYEQIPFKAVGASPVAVWVDNGLIRLRRQRFTYRMFPAYSETGEPVYLDTIYDVSLADPIAVDPPAPIADLSSVVAWSIDPWLLDDAVVEPDTYDWSLPLADDDFRNFSRDTSNLSSDTLWFRRGVSRQSPVVVVTSVGITILNPANGAVFSEVVFPSPVPGDFRATISMSGPIASTADPALKPAYDCGLVHVEAVGKTYRYLIRPARPQVAPVFLGADPGWVPAPRIGEDPDDAPSTGFYSIGGQRYVTADETGLIPVQYTDIYGVHVSPPVPASNPLAVVLDRPITAIVRSVTDLTISQPFFAIQRCQFVVAEDGSALIVADTGDTPPLRLGQRDDGQGPAGHARIRGLNNGSSGARLPGGNRYA